MKLLFLVGVALRVPYALSTLVPLVDPLSGTAQSCQGNVFPAVGVPFGMTHWSPDTTGNQTKCISPYYYEDSSLVGFRGTHFVSGSCMQDYGSFTIMPMSGTLRLTPAQRATPFQHSHESAHPHLYSVFLPNENVQVSLTATARSGILRVQNTASATTRLFVLLQANVPDVSWNDTVVKINSDNTVFASSRVRRLYIKPGTLAGFSGHIALSFSRIPDSLESVRITNTSNGAVAIFDSFAPGEIVDIVSGTSFTSQNAALENAKEEIGSSSFEDVSAAANEIWETSLSSIHVSQENSTHTQMLYTSLYRALLHPRLYNDVSGTYPAFGGSGEIVNCPEGRAYFDDFSMWDIFRAQLPLIGLLFPSKLGDMVWSIVSKAQTTGWLPIFPVWNSFTQEMIGDHAAVAIADAFSKQIVDNEFMQTAYPFMHQNAFDTPSSWDDYVEGKGRRGLQNYTRYGFLPLDDPVNEAFHREQQVSRTLEYSLDDFVVGRVAGILGQKEDEEKLAVRAQSWARVYDEEGFVCGRFANGSFTSPCDPLQRATYLTEDSGWVWSFCVPHNITGLADVMGGTETFVSKLDTLFDQNLYDHGNEPSHHIAYMYLHVGHPQKTQQRVASILRSQYNPGPSGLSGNDDAGQMSAWFVLSAVGLYQVVPSVPEFTIGSPLFDFAEFVMGQTNKVVRVVAIGRSEEKVTISKASWNGVELDKLILSHSQLLEGGELRLWMA